MKQEAKPLHFLTEHQTEQYSDLVSRIEEPAAGKQAYAALKSMEKRRSDMVLPSENVTAYQKAKPVCDAYRKAKSIERYRATRAISLCMKR